jgi:hypothetical protein
MNPYVFIVGCPRSGTTLLRRLVDTHPHIAIIHQSRFIPNFFERRRGLTPEGLVTTKLVDRLLEARGVKNLETSREMLESLVEAGEPVSYSTFVTGVFDLYGKGQGKRLVGDKTPAYVRRIPTLHALWPKAKFVHIIRDGRDVSLSAINWSRAYKLARRYSTWTEDPTTTAAVWWEWQVRLGREDGGSLAPQLYHEVRYEELVSRPAKTCGKICDVLGLPYDEGILKFHKHMPDPCFHVKQNKWRPIVTGLRDWRTQMPAEDLERFEAAAGELLEALGYPRAVSDPPEEMMENTSKIRNAFRQDLLTRGWRLPKGWEQ